MNRNLIKLIRIFGFCTTLAMEAIAWGQTTAPTVSIWTGENATETFSLSVSGLKAPITYSIVVQPAHGTISKFSGQTFLFTPTTGYTGSDSFVYRAKDASGRAVKGMGQIRITESMAVITPVIHVENGTVPDVDALIAAIAKLGGAGVSFSFGADYYWLIEESRASEVLNAVLEWGGSLDNHSHDNYTPAELDGPTYTYSRADVANVLASMGYAVTGVASGYTPDDVQELSGEIFPFLTTGPSWQADYVWGMATAGHGEDDTSWGVTPNAAGTAPQIGGGNTGADSIASSRAMLQAAASGAYPGYLLTSAIMFDPVGLTVTRTTQTVEDVIAFKTESESLGATWMGLEAVGQIYDANYDGLSTRVESSR